MPKVSIVILNWNGWKDTIPCLESLQKINSKDLSVEIVVVDNASNDESVKKINNFKSKFKLTLLQTGSNLGFAGGNNVGLRYSLENNFDYVCVLNNDTIVDEDCIQEFLKSAKKNPDFGILTPKIYFAHGFEFHKDRYTKKDLGKVIWSAGGDLDWANVYGSNHGVDEVDTGQFDKERIVDFATGACMFISSKVLKECGYFDEKYYLYLEDTDLSIRIRNSGRTVIYVPKAIIWHKVSQSSAIGSGLNDYFITRNRLIFGMRYASVRAKYALAREAVRLYFGGRPWQKVGVQDYFAGNLGKGSWGKQLKNEN